MPQKLRIWREWGGVTMWLGSSDGLGDPVDADDLSISSGLRQRLRAWQAPLDDYDAAMNAIDGGGWSHHTREEFQSACQELGLTFPEPAADQAEGLAIWEALERELPSEEYEVIYSDKWSAGGAPPWLESLR